MRKVISLVCSVALVLPLGPGSLVQARQQDGRRTPQQYCLTPAPLPQLDAERETRQQAPSTRRAGAAMAVPAPPPPADGPYAGEGGGDETAIVVTGTRVEAREYSSPVPITTVDAAPVGEVAAPAPATAPPTRGVARRAQPAQSGLLTAGEHDDLLNPELYADYVARSQLGQRAAGLPAFDTRNLLTVEVRDQRGQPMPFVPVELRCVDGSTITLSTVADGNVVFFPDVDKLSEAVEVRTPGTPWRPVRLARQGRGGETVRIVADGSARAVRKLDLMLVIDVTGSMGDELRFLQVELDAIVASLRERHRDLDVRVGFTFYRDRGDQFVTRTFGFDADIALAQQRLAAQSAGGGGDYPEAMQDALIRAARQDWRADAAKTLLLVADAPPHDQDIGTAWLAARHLRSQRVHIVPVGASGVADMAEFVMRAMAASTQSRYTFLTDDSGVGNSHAAPAIDCYLVTRLDSLLRRVIDSQISGRRIEPDEQEVIRAVGEYDAGRCVLPRDFRVAQ